MTFSWRAISLRPALRDAAIGEANEGRLGAGACVGEWADWRAVVGVEGLVGWYAIMQAGDYPLYAIYLNSATKHNLAVSTRLLLFRPLSPKPPTPTSPASPPPALRTGLSGYTSIPLSAINPRNCQARANWLHPALSTARLSPTTQDRGELESAVSLKVVDFIIYCALVFISSVIIMSTSKAKKNSSLDTVLAMLSNMLGGAMLSFPILFKKTGLVSSTIVLFFSAIISFLTCRVYVLHGGENDKDVEWTIRRILGVKWERYFRFITGFYLVLLSIISLELIVDQLYSIFYFFLKDSGIAHKDEFSFRKFSPQWLTLVLFVPLLALVFIKKLKLLVKLSEYGSVSIFIYVAYVSVQFILSVVRGNIRMDEITWFSIDAGSLAGTCSMAFTIHTVVITFLKQSQEQRHNIRNLATTYSLGFIIYELVSVFGAFAIAGSSETCSNTLVDCYLKEWTVLFVEVSYLLGRISGFPLMLEVGRNRLI